MTGPDVGATVAFADYARDVEALRKQLADAQARMEALQAQLESANALLHKKNCAIGKAETTIEALQRERDEARDFLNTVTNDLNEQAGELSQLQALVRALPKVSEVTSDTVVNLVQQYSFHAWILRALQLRATLDATTPATHDQAKATVFNEWDGALRKMADVEPEGGDGE